MTQYEADCLAFVNNTYRPAFGLSAGSGWPAPPPIGSDGPTCANWVDTVYAPWYAQPENSGGTGEHRKPPQPPKKN